MAENTTSTTADRWVDAIDMRSDGVADTLNEEVRLKESLKKDLQTLWVRKTEGKITEAEYNRYANVAKAIFEKQNVGLSEIRQEYQSRREKTLAESNTLLENLSVNVSGVRKKMQNEVSGKMLELQQQFIPQDTVMAYDEDDGNYLINIKDFEKQLRTRPIEDLNGLALKNYFAYLKKNSLLTRGVLLQKLGSQEKLLELSILWEKVLKKQFHARYGLDGAGEKIKSTLKTWLTGTTEKEIEDTIFKGVIVENIKTSWLEHEVLDNKKDRKKSIQELDRKIEKMEYGELMKELNDEFHGKNVNSQMVRDFFKKKNQEDAKKVEALKEKQQKAIEKMTVWETFDCCNIPKNDLWAGIKNKKIDDLTPMEKSQLAKKLKASGAGIQWGIKVFVETQEEIDKRNQAMGERSSMVRDPVAMEVLAKENNNNKNKSKEEAGKKLAYFGGFLFEANKEQEAMESKNRSYQETLAKIGFGGVHILKISENKDMLNEVLRRLERNGLRDTELYTDLSKQLRTQKRKAEIYVMARENITEDELALQKKEGRIFNAFASEMFQQDAKEKKTTDFTVAVTRTEGLVSPANAGRPVQGDLEVRLSSLRDDGKYIPVSEIQGSSCLVKKERDGYIVRIDGKDRECANEAEVKNTIDAYDFFCEHGLKSIASSMEHFLSTVKSTNSVYPDFDVRKWFDPEEQKILLGVVDKIFGLGMEGKMSSKSVSALRADFSSKLNLFVGQKKWFDFGLMEKGVLTPYRSFSSENLHRLLTGQKERDLQKIS